MRSHLVERLTFLFEILIFEKFLELLLIFVLFLKGKTLSVTFERKIVK